MKANDGIPPRVLKFSIVHPGELAAGIHPYREEVKVVVESGEPGGEDGEWPQHCHAWLCEWFEGAGVQLKEDTREFPGIG